MIVSPLPLLRDFGVIVTLNIAIALLAALIVMPVLLVWADERGLIGVDEHEGRQRSVRLAGRGKGPQFIGSLAAAALMAVTAFVLLSKGEGDEGQASASAFAPVGLPTTTTSTTTTTTTAPPAPGETIPAIDPGTFGTARPTGIVTGTLFDLLTANGVEANKAVCTAETLLSRISEDDLLASGIATFSDEALVPVLQAALDCQVTQEQIDATVTQARGG